MPVIPPDDGALLAECDVETLSAGTKGGQRANKVETGVRLTHRPTGLRVQRRTERSQIRNRSLALQELRRRLELMNRPQKVRHATKPTKGSKRRRLDAKKRQAETKANRQKPEW